MVYRPFIFTLEELPSFGVGRIRSLYMYPFSFDEFLMAQGLDTTVSYKQQASSSSPLPDAVHNKLVDQLKTFYLDYLEAKDGVVLPIEVKAATRGSMQSLWLFMRKKALHHAVRTSLENFGEFEYIDKEFQNACRHVDVIQLYAISNLLKFRI